MTRSEMQAAVVLYTILTAISMVLCHEVRRNAYDNVWEDPVVKNYTRAMKASLTLHNTTMSNGTAPVTWNSGVFYSSKMPYNLCSFALLSPLAYYWNIYLERFSGPATGSRS